MHIATFIIMARYDYKMKIMSNVVVNVDINIFEEPTKNK